MEDDWICIVCLKSVSSEEYPEPPDAVGIEVEVDGSGKVYFARHSSCEMNDEARLRLAQMARESSRD